jgi:DUF4097 and DUF4098 domain-containing protein YvlB
MTNTRILYPLFSLMLLACMAFGSSTQDKWGTKSFNVAKGGTLEVSLDNGDIRITGWDRNEVSVKALGISSDEADQIKIEQSGNRVTVRSRSEWGEGNDLRLDINVPSQFDLDLETANGNIELTGPLTGRLRGSTSGGDIRLGNLGGTVDMNTSGGDIHAGDMQGDMLLRTSGGDLRIGSVSGEAEISTSGGDISMENVGKRLRASTSGGEVRIGNVGGDASVRTAGGDIHVGKVSGSADLNTAGGDIDLQAASGKVSARTAGGNLNLDQVTGSVDGSTAGGDVMVHLVPGKNGRSRLSTSAGDIHLFVPEDAKATIEARIRYTGWRSHGDEEYTIRSDFKMEKVEGGDSRNEKRATITLNGGGERITLDANQGNIEIRKAK